MKDGLSLQVWAAPAEFQFAKACKGFKGLQLVKGFKHKPAYFFRMLQQLNVSIGLHFSFFDANRNRHASQKRMISVMYYYFPPKYAYF